MIINHNINATIAYNRANLAGKTKSNAMEKLSSGMRINKAADDSAGSTISQQMRSQIRGLEQASRNIQDGTSLIQTAESGLGEIENPNLQRIRKLCVKASNGTLTDEDRKIIQKEIDEIKNGINDIANNTEFNKIKLLRPPISETSLGKADIVFVVDNTGSMSGIQTTVANNITNFIDSITTQGVTDIRMGLVEYKDSTINNFDFSGSKWTNDTSDIYNGLLQLASTNSGATENAMQALTETSNYYDFRSNDNGNQTKHIIFITDEDADDDVDLPSTLSLIQSDGIQVSGVYYTTAGDVSEFNTTIGSTGGVSVNLSDANWDDQLSSIIGSHIVSSAGTKKMPVLNLQVGANSGQEFKVELFDARTKNLGIDSIKVDSIKEAEKSLKKVDKAIELVSNQRSKFGAYENALEHIKNNVENYNYNITSAESRISDADMAKEMMKMTKGSIIEQSAQSILKQAQKIPESVIDLMNKWQENV